MGENSLMDHGILNLGPYGAAALGLAGLAPGIAGSVASGLQLGGRVNNLMAVDRLRSMMGVPQLSGGQLAGGLIGGNGYGSLSGNNTIANPDQFKNPLNGQPTAITTGGLYDNGSFLDRALAQLGGFFGIGTGYAQPLGAFTLSEAMHRNAVAGLPPGFFSQRAGVDPRGGLMGGQGTSQNPGQASGTGYVSGSASGLYGGPADIGGTPTLMGDHLRPDLYGGLSPSAMGGVGAPGGGYMSSRAGQGSYSDGMGGTTSVGASGQLGHI